MHKMILEALSSAIEKFMASSYVRPEIVLEFHDGISSFAFQVKLKDLSYSFIEQQLEDESSFRRFSFICSRDLTNEEWSIENGRLKVLSPWGKILKRMDELDTKDPGKYVVVQDDIAVEIEIYSGIYGLEPVDSAPLRKLPDEGKAEELYVYHIPEGYTWNTFWRDKYPYDDPGADSILVVQVIKNQ